MLALIASSFLIKGTLTTSAKDIVEMSKANWYSHEKLGKNITQQQADVKVGFVLLLLSFVFQMVNLLWPMRYKDFAINRAGLIIAVCVSIIVGIGSLYLSQVLSKKIYKKVIAISEQRSSTDE